MGIGVCGEGWWNVGGSYGYWRVEVMSGVGEDWKGWGVYGYWRMCGV